MNEKVEIRQIKEDDRGNNFVVWVNNKEHMRLKHVGTAKAVLKIWEERGHVWMQ